MRHTRRAEVIRNHCFNFQSWKLNVLNGCRNDTVNTIVKIPTPWGLFYKNEKETLKNILKHRFMKSLNALTKSIVTIAK